MFSNVLLAYDGSPQAQDALRLAAALSAPGGKVTACCVHHMQTVSGAIDLTEPRPGREDAKRCARHAADLLPNTLQADTLVLEAVDAAQALQDAVRSRKADLLVLGPSHRGRLGRVALGSVAMRALHDPPCPVAVARSGARHAEDTRRIASIAVGCDVLEDPGPELDLAVELAADLRATLHVVAVADTRVALAAELGGAIAYPAVLKARRLAAEEGLADVLAGLPREISVTGEVREGGATEKLMEVSSGVDLLVLGTHHYGPLSRLRGRSVSGALARQARCPLLAVPR